MFSSLRAKRAKKGLTIRQKENMMNPAISYNACTLCPRMCGVDRRRQTGYCKMSSALSIARATLHMWEEPCISGTAGSGTVFFSGCTLKCIFCQNYPLSHEGFGKEITVSRLSDIFLELQEQGAHNINLVTATHYMPSVLDTLDQAKPRLSIPIVYNCGGYERVETIRALEGYIDIYLPDLKYYDNAIAQKYSSAGNYFSCASSAIKEMLRQTGGLTWDLGNPQLLSKGVIIRHMVLPGMKDDSIRLLHWIKETLPPHQYLLSLLSQYTPCFHSSAYPEINRRITSYEYNKVVDTALALGLDEGYLQKKSSAKEEYTPPFDLSGVEK